jgi:hypothetical protein
MTLKPFDIERVKHNWDRVAAAPSEPLPQRLLALTPPKDPLPEAQRLLARITHIAQTQFGAHRASLEPFLGEAQELLTRMREASSAPPERERDATTVAPEPPVDLAPLRKQFLAALDDLQDLFEVYAGIGLR